MNDKNNLLFTAFEPTTKEAWLEKVNIDLKGADFNKKLVWKNLNKIDFQPFLTSQDKIKYLKNTTKSNNSLVNYRRITVNTSATKANKLARKATQEGINGLLFKLDKTVAANKLLADIDLSTTSVSFILKSKTLPFVNDFFDYVKKMNVPKEKLKGYFNQNIIYDYVTTGEVNYKKFDKIVELINLSKDYPNFKTISISGAVFLNSGANQVQEIAYTLNALVYFIEKCTTRAVKIQDIFNNLHIELAIGSEYFIEISKFRVFNNLLHEIANKYNITNFSYTLSAKTSIWNKSIIDAHTNILRATTEAMSAILGNVDAIEIDSYDSEFNESNSFSSRIAGNIATILKEESYFGKVNNPVDGSYYVEEISTKIAESALKLFQSIEENGGFFLAFENEQIQTQIAEICLIKTKLISQRRLAMVGINKYPNLMETTDAKTFKGEPILSNNKILKPHRAAHKIELLKKVTEVFVASHNFRPIVEITSFGNLTMRKARASFAYDFMGVSGYIIQDEVSYDSSDIAAKTSAQSNSNVVIICSSDQDYETDALAFIKTFRTINTTKVLLLAGNPKNMNKLESAGLNGCIHIKSNIIQTIGKVQDKIQKTLKPLEV